MNDLVGSKLSPLVLPPISRHTLALYCGGSGDHNPIHVDIDFARQEAGLDDVIAHGMLVMAYLGRLLAGHGGAAAVQRMKTRFRAPILIGDVITCEAEVVAVDDGLARLALAARRADGTVLVDGEADVYASQLTPGSAS